MGDRGNIVIREEPSWLKPEIGSHEAVFLYGHWSGHDLPEIVRTGLTRGRERWTDGQYLARIMFEELVGSARGGATGFGIASRLHDNEYDLLVLLPGAQALARITEKAYAEHGFAALDDAPTISFEDYTAASERTWDNLTEAESAAPR